jgi:Icc-related predicted phosphoesterase
MSTQFIFYSDLHLEFGDYQVPVHKNERELGVVLAGDIHTKTNAVPFLEQLSHRFKYVIYVLGNHEHYGESVLRTQEKIQERIGNLQLDNVYVLDNECVIIDDVVFVGSTLWTSIDNGNPISMNTIQNIMSDFKYIKYGLPGMTYRKFRPTDAMIQHRSSVHYIFNTTKDYVSIGSKVVVITHHAPSHRSLPGGQLGSDWDPGYYSPLDNEILNGGPDIWIHGHVHESNDYTIGNTRVLSNPRGYIGDSLNPKFEDSWLIRI